MNWPFSKKNREKGINRGKGVAIHPGGTFELPLPPIRFDGDKCFIFINGNEELLNEDGFIVEIKADDARPLKVKVFPDCKNRRLGMVEIIDANDNKEYPKDGPQLKFAGIGDSKEYTKRYVDIMKQRLNEINENIIRTNKKIRRNCYIAVIMILIMVPIGSYFAYTQTGILRYINLAIIIVGIAAAYVAVWSIRNANKIDREIGKEKIGKESGKIEIVKEK